MTKEVQDAAEAQHIVMSWDDVEVAIGVLLGQFKEVGYQPTNILAVAKGGVIPATLIHQAFPEANFHTVHIRSYMDEYFLADGPVYKQIPRVEDCPNVHSTLVVDDILETGATMRFLQRRWNRATYAFMACRWSQAGNCIYRGYIAPRGWVDFPWEKPLEETEIPF